MESARHPSPPSLRLGTLFWMLWAAVAIPAHADYWYKHYDQAEKALKAGQWAEAITQLELSLERRGDSGAKVKTYGMNFTAYFPHLKLGIAYYQLGQIEAALQAFETEEVLGAIARSDSARVELENYRTLARQALEAVAAEEQKRIRDILAGSLREARDFEARGLLDEAIGALGRGLSVVPDDAQALARLDQLRRKLAQQQQEQQALQRARDLVEEGRTLLGVGRLGEASTALQRALSLGAGDQARSLLETAQAQLREEAARAAQEQDAAQHAAAVTARLREAATLEASGKLDDALDRLQSVIALDPANDEALAMQRRILGAQEVGERESARREEIRRLLGQAEADFAGQRFEAVLTSANRVLALAPDDATALGLVLKAYRHISAGLLGGGRQNVPPAVSFADLREDLPDGSRAQRVELPSFQMTGLVIDESPVTIVFEDQLGNEIPSTIADQPLGEFVATRFTLRAKLAPGSSIFRLVATDEEGRSSSSEYAVIYTPPFFRTAWFYTALSAALAILAGAFSWRRHQRRQRLLKRRFNPYVAGAPVLDEDLFMGRDQLVDRILQTVHNNSLLLYGERRIGKTSLQHHLKKRLLQLDDPVYDFFPAYIDLQGTPEEKFFATLAEDTFHDLASVLDGLECSLTDDKAYTHRDLVRDLRRVIKVLKTKSTKKVKLVLLIDEVDELNEYDPKINQKLRSLFMKSFAENLVSVVSGVGIKKQWQREGSPWYNFFEEIEVKPFRRKDAEELIEKPIRGIFKLEDGVTDRMIQVTDGKPYLIQKLCIALVNRLYEQGRRRITISDVKAVGRPSSEAL